ncbi:MAG: hypothetical protein CSA65_09495 [Proteobacteria bacterium]|nr:MAG: hypothetical protein CSA65_09495 [Pseudomonadota bacterium]
MSLLNELSSATGDKNSNNELVKRCLTTPAFLHSISEGLRTGTPKAQDDCMFIMLEIGKRRPELLSTFASDFFDTSRGATTKSKKLRCQALEGLSRIAHVAGSELFAEREYLLETARAGGPQGLAAAGVLAALCAASANYRGKLLVHTLRLFKAVPAKALPRWVAALAPSVEGSADGLKRFLRELEPRRGELDDAANKKVDKVIVTIERTIKR